jgi:SAM-dependent methyltransferase
MTGLLDVMLGAYAVLRSGTVEPTTQSQGGGRSPPRVELAIPGRGVRRFHLARELAVDSAPGATPIVESMDMRSTDNEELDRLLDEQLAYYRALAPDYLDQGLDLPGGREVAEALEAFQPTGSVLELACGPGVWTSKLLRHATDVTAVDASPEMLAIAAARVGSQRVRFIQADLFTWKPGRQYDIVFIGFWLSHVPAERFESFWSLVADCLKPEGRVFIADDAYRTPDELIEGPYSSTIRRQIPDGTAFRLVKVPHQPANLERQLRELGWHIKVTTTSGPFYWGAGSRASLHSR